MMNIEKIVGDVVMLALQNTEALQPLGIEEQLYAKVLGFDQIGIWVEHPSFPIPVISRKEGRQGQPERVTASLLIPWGNIVSVAHFPDVEDFDFPDPTACRPIGFNSD